MRNLTWRSAGKAIGTGAAFVCLAFTLLDLSASVARAAAGEYDVEVCTSQGDATGHGLNFDEEPGSARFFDVSCAPIAGKPTIGITAQTGTVKGFAEWTIDAPAGALIRSVQGNRQVKLVGFELSPDIKWAAFATEAPLELFEFFSLTTPPADGPFTWTPATPTPTVHGRVVCASGSGCENKNGEEQVFATDVVAHVVDQSPPAITTAGPLLAAGPLNGTKQLSFKASDTGSGVAKVSLEVDGQVKESKTDTNGGLCVSPYHAMAPCKAVIDSAKTNSSFDFDTTAVPDGPHKVEVVVEDASGQSVSSPPATIDVHNRPTNTGRPALSGVPKIGQALAASRGLWDGSPTSFGFQWLRCPTGVKVAQEAGCTPVAGATGDSYAVTAADGGSRLVARVTATNGFGAEPALSVPSETIAEPAPQTRILKHPRKKTALRVARFAFGSDRPGSSFMCKLDKAAFKPCASPFKRKVKPGRHSFQVRATNATGQADPKPAVFRWRVS